MAAAPTSPMRSPAATIWTPRLSISTDFCAVIPMPFGGQSHEISAQRLRHDSVDASQCEAQCAGKQRDRRRGTEAREVLTNQDIHRRWP